MLAQFMNGGLSYDAAHVVDNTAAHFFWIMFACSVSFVGAYMQYFGAIRMGFLHRTHSIPLIGNLWFFAHDTTYVTNYRHWFEDVDFWLVKAFWFALVVFMLCEMVVTYQILRFSRRTLFPDKSFSQALCLYLGLQLFAYGLFWWFMSMIRDPYYYLSFSTTVVLAPLLNIALMRARGSRRGFSLSMLWGFVLLTGGFWAWMFASDAYFRQPFFWLVALGNVAISVASIREFARLPPYVPGTANS
jgi:hypothetical protein